MRPTREIAEAQSYTDDGLFILRDWHVADSSLHTLCGNQAAKNKIFGVIRQYVFDNELDATHGTCCKIWKQLGVGPDTGYALPPNAAELLAKSETRAELKRLFAIVFTNDRVVLEHLREAADINAEEVQ